MDPGAHPAGTPGVVTCSALKKRYRDVLRGEGVVFVFLEGSKDKISDRLASRHGHFMPPALLESQFEALEAAHRGRKLHHPVCFRNAGGRSAGNHRPAESRPWRRRQAQPPTAITALGTHFEFSDNNAASGCRRGLDRPRHPTAGGGRPRHRAHRGAHCQVQAPPLPLARPRLRVRGPRLRRGTGQGHHQLRGRRRRRPEGSRAAHRPRRDAGQAARRLRRSQPRGGHPARQGHRQQGGLVHHARRRDHRPADVLRDRPRAAAARDRAGHPTLQDAAHAHCHPGAGRPVRAARARAAAPRTPDRDQRRQGRARHDAGAGPPRGHPHRHHLRPAVLPARRPVGPGRAPPPSRAASTPNTGRTWKASSASRASSSHC